MNATRLQEVREAAPLDGPHRGPNDGRNDGKIIDASFSIVSQRTIWRRVKLALLAVVCAAAIGFIIPPLWIVAQHIAQAPMR
jgi:hypothetical protein